ncbi:Low-density lipoprotein receptor domain class A [Cooperia oncophora]
MTDGCVSSIRTLKITSASTTISACNCNRLLCDMHLSVKGPCARCIRVKETNTRCPEYRWKKLCGLPSSIKCASTPNCVLPTWIMDGKDDCGDGSDEEIPMSCERGQFRCISGECIDGELVMDGKNDCFDNSDEGKDEVTYFVTRAHSQGP